jgi:cytochrome c556
MPTKTLILSTLAATLTLSAIAFAEDTPALMVDPAIATMTNDQLVAARQAAMKEDGMLLRGAGDLTGDAAIAAATTLLQNFTNFPVLFKEGSVTDKSKAQPAIWENWDDFKARFDADAAAASVMLAAAVAGDTAAFAAAVEEIGKSCGGCHMTYRAR